MQPWGTGLLIFCAPFPPSVRCLGDSTADSHCRGSVIGAPALPPDLCRLLPLSWVVLFLSAKGQREERSQVSLDLVASHLPHVRGDKALPFTVPRFPQREDRMGWECTAQAQCISPGGPESQAEPKTVTEESHRLRPCPFIHQRSPGSSLVLTCHSCQALLNCTSLLARPSLPCGKGLGAPLAFQRPPSPFHTGLQRKFWEDVGAFAEEPP